MKAEKPDKQDKTSNRIALTGIFALGGWKITTMVTTKIGALIDCAITLKNGGGLKEAGLQFKEAAYQSLRCVFFRRGAHHELFKVAPYSAAGISIGSVLGIIGGLVLAFTRGDRLENAWDLFKHPIESMKKVFSNEATKPSAIAAEPKPIASPATVTRTVEHVHQGKVMAPEKSLAI